MKVAVEDQYRVCVERNGKTSPAQVWTKEDLRLKGAP
jgi:hypothetical protein